MCDVLLAIAIVICGVGVVAGQSLWLVTIPMLLSAVGLRMLVPHLRYLKQMGWSLLAVNVLSGMMQVWIWNG